MLPTLFKDIEYPQGFSDPPFIVATIYHSITKFPFKYRPRELLNTIEYSP